MLSSHQPCVVNEMRSVFEPIVQQHFGDMMDEFVRIGSRHWSLRGNLKLKDMLAKDTMVVVSLMNA